MLRRLFIKETFEHIEEELRAIYKVFGIKDQTLKVKKQPATYSKSYNYVIEGNIEGHHFVLSLHQTALKVQETKQQLELIIQCENPNWMTFVLRKKNDLPSKTKKTLGTAPIPQLKNVNLEKLIVEASDPEWTKNSLDVPMGKKLAIMDDLKFSSFILERKRLYVQMPWLPEDFSKRQALIQVLDFSISLVKKIDAQE